MSSSGLPAFTLHHPVSDPDSEARLESEVMCRPPCFYKSQHLSRIYSRNSGWERMSEKEHMVMCHKGCWRFHINCDKLCNSDGMHQVALKLFPWRRNKNNFFSLTNPSSLQPPPPTLWRNERIGI